MTTLRTAPWPWPALATADAHPARVMLDVLSGLPILGWEASCRLSARGIQTGRLLAGIDRAALSASRWGKLFDEVSVPTAHRHAIEQDLALADRIYVACEQGTHNVTRKIYLEFGSAIRHRSAERLSILGYKWTQPKAASADTRITEYWTQEQTDARQTTSDLRHKPGSPAVDPGVGVPVVHVLIQALTKALSLAGLDSAWRHEHIKVYEPGLARASFAFNFYDSGLRAGDLTEAVAALADKWALNAAEVRQLLDAIAQRDLVWLAGGLDTNGEPFLTIYCAASSEDAIQACFAADPTLGNSGPRTAGSAA
jgi:hypothetical protein